MEQLFRGQAPPVPDARRRRGRRRERRRSARHRAARGLPARHHLRHRRRRADVTPGPFALRYRRPDLDVRTPKGSVGRRVVAGRAAERLQHPRGGGDGVALDLPLAASSRRARPRPVCRAASKSSRHRRRCHGRRGLRAHRRRAAQPARDRAPLAPQRLVTVFGCGGDRDTTKRPLMGMVAARLSDVVIVTSDNPRSEDPGADHRRVRRGIRPVDASSAGRHAESRIVDRGEAIEQAIEQARPAIWCSSPAKDTRNTSRSATACCRSTMSPSRGRRWARRRQADEGGSVWWAGHGPWMPRRWRPPSGRVVGGDRRGRAASRSIRGSTPGAALFFAIVGRRATATSSPEPSREGARGGGQPEPGPATR